MRGDGYRHVRQGPVRLYRLCLVSPVTSGGTWGISSVCELDQPAASAISVSGGITWIIAPSLQGMLYTTALGKYFWDINDRWRRHHEQCTKWFSAGLLSARDASC